MSFFTCTLCKMPWKTMNDFLQDKEVDLIGYQMSTKDIEDGLFLFTHKQDQCGTTIGMRVHQFSSLFKGVRHTNNAFGTKECEQRCTKINELASCKVPCSNAYARDILQAILKAKVHKE